MSSVTSSALVLVAFASVAACSTPSAPSPRAPANPSANPRATPQASGDTTISIDGDPNGLFWNAATETLLIADGDGNRVLAWKEGKGVSTVAAMPATHAKHAGLGQPVQLADGTIVVPRFGGGADGDVAFVHSDGSSGVVAKLDVARRRIGLTVAPDGSIYDTYFVMNGAEHVGGVARVDLTNGGESDLALATGLQKPVGVLASGNALLVSEQGAGRVVSLPLEASGTLPAPTVIATVPSADLLTAGPDGSFFTGGRDGAVHQIARGGRTSVFASGYSEVRGVAYDGKLRRLFFVDHVKPGVAGKASVIVVRNVP